MAFDVANQTNNTCIRNNYYRKTHLIPHLSEHTIFPVIASSHLQTLSQPSWNDLPCVSATPLYTQKFDGGAGVGG